MRQKVQNNVTPTKGASKIKAEKNGVKRGRKRTQPQNSKHVNLFKHKHETGVISNSKDNPKTLSIYTRLLTSQ